MTKKRSASRLLTLLTPLSLRRLASSRVNRMLAAYTMYVECQYGPQTTPDPPLLLAFDLP